MQIKEGLCKVYIELTGRIFNDHGSYYVNKIKCQVSRGESSFWMKQM
jgi:hypothetical protein